jgi:DNA mismatch repair protein MutS2
MEVSVVSLEIGDDVVVRPLGKKRGSIIAKGRNGQYQVRVEGLTAWCREEDLAIPPRPGKKQLAREKALARAKDRAPSVEANTSKVVARRVDLHGLAVDAAIARVVDEIDRAVLDGAERLEVVHGKGSGRIRHALHRHLASMHVVAAFKLDERNAGVTWVYL